MLDSLQVPFVRVDHDALPTIEACREADQLLGTDFYLLLMPGNKKFKTAVLSKQIGSARLSFGEAEFMESFLNITPGSVSVMGLMNDREKRVRLLIDKDILEGEYFACHPCINTSSLREKESICKRIYIQKNLYIKVSIYKRFPKKELAALADCQLFPNLVLAVLLTDSFHLLVDGSRVCGHASFVSGHDNFWLNSFFIYIYKIGTFPRVCP